MKTLSIVEAAEFLKVHPDTVRKWARAGKIPCMKMGKQWLLIEEDLAQFIRSNYISQQHVPERGSLTWEAGCQKAITAAAKNGGSVSPRQAAKLLEARLGLKTKKPTKNSATG